jgi:hypothetical protein
MASGSFHIQWGDVASWVVGIATATTFFATYGLLRSTRREQRAQQAVARQAQARLVSAWCHDVKHDSGKNVDTVTVTFQNDSDEPIYGLRVAVGSRWSGDSIEYAEPETNLAYVIPPKHHDELKFILRLESMESYDNRRFPPVELMFCDASGRTFWHRDRNGHLSQIEDGSPPLAKDYFFTSPKTRLISKLSLQVRQSIRRS